MEELIRDGALRVLTTDASCDVILCCSDYRLSAHKIILSIASPLLQDLLKNNTTVPSIVLLPDIPSSVMALLLDYIYTGSVNIRSEILKDFLQAASLLQIKILNDELYSKIETKNLVEKDEQKMEMDVLQEEKKVLKVFKRKLPNLLPIASVKFRKSLNSHVSPSPWCPRLAPLIGDPRIDHTNSTLPQKNDSNNNFQISHSVLPSVIEAKVRKTKFIHKKAILGYNHATIPSDKVPVVYKQQDKNLEDCVALDLKNSHRGCKSDSSDGQAGSCNEADGFLQVDLKTSSSAENSSVETEIDNEKEHDRDTAKKKSDQNKPFKCEECGKCFSQLRNYKYHRSIHEGTKEFAARCPECGKTFNDKGYLSSHMKIHRDRKEYGCPHCPKRFNQRVAYNMHLRIHTGVKPHECQTCGKTFSRKMLLKQHQRVHTGERPYSCPECGKSFADRSNMSLHARLHTGVKPYTCNLCSKSFTKKHHLKTHMNFHTGLKPYTCQKCGLAFSQSSNMRTHYKKCILKPSDTSEPENT